MSEGPEGAMSEGPEGAMFEGVSSEGPGRLKVSEGPGRMRVSEGPGRMGVSEGPGRVSEGPGRWRVSEGPALPGSEGPGVEKEDAEGVGEGTRGGCKSSTKSCSPATSDSGMSETSAPANASSGKMLRSMGQMPVDLKLFMILDGVQALIHALHASSGNWCSVMCMFGCMR